MPSPDGGGVGVEPTEEVTVLHGILWKTDHLTHHFAVPPPRLRREGGGSMPWGILTIPLLKFTLYLLPERRNFILQ